MWGLLAIDNCLDRCPLKGCKLLQWLSAACHMSVRVIHLYCRVLIFVLNEKVLFFALCFCGIRVWPVIGAVGAPLGHHSAKTSWRWFHVPDSHSSQSERFPKKLLKKQSWKWLGFYLEVEMTLSFQWTVVGFSTVCLKSWLLRSKFLSLCWVEQSCWRWGKGLRPILEKSEFKRASYPELLICKKHCLPWFWKGSLCKFCMCIWLSAHGELIWSQEYLLLPVSKSQIICLNFFFFFQRCLCWNLVNQVKVAIHSR